MIDLKLIKRSIPKWFLMSTIFSSLTVIIIMDSSLRENYFLRVINTVNETDFKNVTIFAGTGYFSGSIDGNLLSQCSKRIRKYCMISNSYMGYVNADAIVLHSRNFYQFDQSAYPQRNFNIPYVFWVLESPSNENIEVPKDLINWTMTYRTDSDIYYPYGKFELHNKPVAVDYHQMFVNKTKSTIWLVSNCNTVNNRMNIADQLVNSGLQIDIFGKCTHEPDGCPRYGGTKNCEEQLLKEYKFYIAFENSNCEDYVTEKFYKYMRAGLIPIVISRKFYKKFPKSSFIALDDFPTVKQCVEYIQRVQKDETLYKHHHEWREKFNVINSMNPGGGCLSEDGNIGICDDLGFCGLCEKLLEYKTKEISVHKTYHDVNRWFYSSKCYNNIRYQ